MLITVALGWFKVVGNFSSDDVQLMNVYEGDLVQNLGSVLQGIQV